MGLSELLKLKEKYSDLPFEAIVKTDLLRLGVAFSPTALKVCSEAKPKSYFIFSFNQVPQSELSALEQKSAPEEIALMGGPHDFKRTIVSVRMNPKSPYQIGMGTKTATLQLSYNNEEICSVLLPPFPSYYSSSLANGKPITDIAPTIEWGYLIYLTAFRLCQYWGAEEECQFCDINNNYREQKEMGRPYTGVKTPEEILEALTIINEKDIEKTSHAYTITGGSITRRLNGMNESEFYSQYARAIEKKFPGRWMGKAVVQALPLDEVKLLKDSGYQIYHPNFEVWDKKLFTQLCPGKDRYVGRDEWIQRIVDAAKIFGPENVIPNFVGGIEMSKPYGFQNLDDAIASTAEGLEFFMSQGICPRFTVWCVEPGTTLTQSNPEPPPLEYYLRLLQVYRDIFQKHRLPIPPGYGEAGLGKAVFSVSAFMDVLPEASLLTHHDRPA